MNQVDFHVKVRDSVRYAYLLIRKLIPMGRRVTVWSDNEPRLRMLYDGLYRFDDQSFIPHAWIGDGYESECSIWFARSADDLRGDDVLIVLCDELPDDWKTRFAPFDRVVDISDASAASLQAARNRYKIYKLSGIKLQHYDRSQTS